MKENKGVKRRAFLQASLAAGLGALVGGCAGFSKNGPANDVYDEPSKGIFGLGVQMRVREAWEGQKRISVNEIKIAPGAETLIELNKTSKMSFEVKEGKGLILRANQVSIESNGVQRQVKGGQPFITKGEKAFIGPGIAHQMFNSTDQEILIEQFCDPGWIPETAFYLVGKTQIPATDIWFELRESTNQIRPGFKCRLDDTSDLERGIASILLEGGTASLPQYFKESTHTYTLLEGNALIAINDESREMAVNQPVKIPNGTKFQLMNKSDRRCRLTAVTEPGWVSNDSFYQVGRDFVPGSKVWFALRLAAELR